MIGLRVRQIRELLGWTQVQLAQASGISQAQVSDIESGASTTAETITSIAGSTGFSESWLRRPVPEEFPEGTIRYRKRSGSAKRDDRRSVRRLELAAELTEIMGENFRLTPQTVQYLGEPLGPEDIDEKATETRLALNLPSDGPVRNLIRAVERGGAIVVGLPVDFGSVGRLQHHHGVSAWPELDHRPVIGFSTSDPGDRQRHTVAHEVGHLVLHRGLPNADRNYEREADRFAGALLMPRQDALAAFSPTTTLRRLTELKAMWGVSIAALIMRAQQVGAIDEARHESLFKQLSARGWRLNEPVTVHREQPALLPRLLEANYGNPIDWRRAGKSIGLPPHLLRELACVAERDRSDPDSRSALVELASRRASNQARLARG